MTPVDVDASLEAMRELESLGATDVVLKADGIHFKLEEPTPLKLISFDSGWHRRLWDEAVVDLEWQTGIRKASPLWMWEV